jgi:hypothetical protein
MMTRSLTLSSALALGLLCSSTAAGQTQAPALFARDVCVKVRDGKWQEYSAFLQNVTAKLAKVRVESGAYASYAIAQSVSPTGRSARCDYHLVTTYSGFPPDAAGAEQTAADMKKAGITMTREAMIAKRNELSYLVGVDTWRWRERVGRSAKGAVARINYDKIHSGMGAEWLSLESNGWKQLAEAASAEHGTAWRTATLVMPGGEDLPYNAMTIDVFPNWAALGKGIPARPIWNKVHPNSDISAHLARLAVIRDRPRVDVVRLVEFIEK